MRFIIIQFIVQTGFRIEYGNEVDWLEMVCLSGGINVSYRLFVFAYCLIISCCRLVSAFTTFFLFAIWIYF